VTHEQAETDVAGRLQRYAELLRASPHNLLSPRALAELEARHFVEGLRFAQDLPGGPALLDIGSGGGLHGIVVAIARPDLSVQLMDSTGKKARFLESVITELALTATVHHGRAEDLARGSLSGTFDVVTARAVAPLQRLIPLARPFLRIGGTLHAIKGERWPTELAEAERELASGAMVIQRLPGQEGDEDGGPAVVVLERRK
jgi:16S rRNA (guanine527-N7)-methyltransferase